MRYEITTLGGPLLKLPEIASNALAWIGEAAAGTVLGHWRTEIGELGKVLILRGFDTEQELARERQRDSDSRDPFNGGDLGLSIVQESYRGFPFLPAVTPRAYGGIYEFRTYFLKPGGLSPTLDGWRAAIEPAKEYTDHLVINMIALDGPPRITHIWGFTTIQQRFDLRAKYYAAKLWPPKGGPEQIAHATSTIALANDGSPLC
jgi:hypothetical protein